MNKIYLDYASTTPVDPAVLSAMLPYFGTPISKLSTINYPLSTSSWGNPGSLHSFGQAASGAVFKARQTLAAELGCHYSEIIFTGSATEANNLAIQGVVGAWHAIQATNKKFEKTHEARRPKVIVSAIEHESVLNVAEGLHALGQIELVIVPVDARGLVDLGRLKKSLDDRTILVSVMFANNETGVIQPIPEISKLIRNWKLEIGNSSSYPLLHTDAVQAFQYLECDVRRLGVDLLTLSAQKIYGPKGIGALYVPNPERLAKGGVTNKDIFPLSPLIMGGGQERNLRSGTENVPAIAGFAKAVELVSQRRQKEIERVSDLRDQLWAGIKKIFPKAQINGAWGKVQGIRLPNNLNIYLPGVSGLPAVTGEQLLVALDLQGIAISSGSACSARSIDPSHVLLAMGQNKERAKNSLRITLGRPTNKKEIQKFLEVIKKVSSRL